MLVAPLRWALRLALALAIVFEEWGYVPLRQAMAWVARMPALRPLERLLRGLPPYGALCALGLPSLLILPLKVLALWLLAGGHAFAGLAVIVSAKVGGTAVLAWVFHLVQPALMQLGWFAALYGKWSAWKAELLGWVRASAVWRAARAFRAAVRRVLRRAQAIPSVKGNNLERHMANTKLDFTAARAHGYTIHQGGPEDDHLNGKFWWSRCRAGWSGVETSEGEWATAAEAEADAVRAVNEESAAGELVS